MRQTLFRTRWAVLALAIVGLTTLAGRGDPGCLSLESLSRMSAGELDALFRASDLGQPLVGVARGRLLCSTDRVLPRVKRTLSNSVWRGKTADEDGYFINRWVGRVEWISSHYAIGPSWLDGRDAIIMEYAPKTPLFANTRDELREVAPGLYLGPLFDRCPCPRLRGYIGLELQLRHCPAKRR